MKQRKEISMKKRMTLMSVMALVLTAIFTLSACSASSKSADYAMESSTAAYASSYAVTETAYEEYDADFGYYESGVTNASGASVGVTDPQDIDPTGEAKLIYRAYLNVSTIEFEDATEKIQALVQQNGGYIESSNLYSGSVYRSSNFSVRIPVENYRQFVTSAQDVGQVDSFSENVENITDSYYDTELRLETARMQLETLQRMMSEATDMEDMITIQSAISDTQYEIDYLSGNLRHYDNLVGYSTVNINVQEVSELRGQEQAPIGFGQRLSQAFKRGISNMGYALEDLLIGFANHWIGWIIFIAIVIIAIILIRKSVRQSREKEKAHALALEQQRQMAARQGAVPAPVNPQAPDVPAGTNPSDMTN